MEKPLEVCKQKGVNQVIESHYPGLKKCVNRREVEPNKDSILAGNCMFVVVKLVKGWPIRLKYLKNADVVDVADAVGGDQCYIGDLKELL